MISDASANSQQSTDPAARGRPAPAGPGSVWVDADPSLGVRFRDVDDALAILVLLASPEVSLEGISINFGNVKASRGFAIAEDLLSRVGSEVPVFRGASSRRELGTSNPAVEALMKKVAEKPGRVRLLAIAPLTNVATAMMLDPSFGPNLRELVVLGGARSLLPFSVVGDFNFRLDIPAVRTVLGAPIRKTVVTMDLCSQVVFRREHLERLRAHPGALGERLAGEIAPWLVLNRLFFRRGGFFPWDAVAAAYLIAPELFNSHPCLFGLADHGWRRGRIADLQVRDDFQPVQGRVPVNLPHTVDAERVMELLLERLLSLSNRRGIGSRRADC